MVKIDSSTMPSGRIVGDGRVADDKITGSLRDCSPSGEW
jgi:hypothetical protein